MGTAGIDVCVVSIKPEARRIVDISLDFPGISCTEGITNMIKKCAACGGNFQAKGNSKFCSEKCRNAKIPTEDHIGEKHFELKVISAYRKKSILYVECECSCGKKCAVRYDALLSGNTQSCGHIGNENLIKPADLTGKTNKFGVKALRRNKKLEKGYLWHCLCPCGKEFDTTSFAFQKIKSCGCARDRALEEHINGILKESRENAKQDGTYIHSIKEKKMLKNNTSGIRGVTWDKSRQKWVAQIEFKGNHYHLGRYDKKEEAEEARRIAEKEMFGDFLKWFSEEFPERWEKINRKTTQEKK